MPTHLSFTVLDFLLDNKILKYTSNLKVAEDKEINDDVRDKT